MVDDDERSTPDRRDRLVRLLLAVLAAIIAVNLWFFVRSQQGDRRLRVRRAADLEQVAAHARSRPVRYHHGTYYRLARELHGATLHIDQYTARQHRWALEALGDLDVEVSRHAVIRLGAEAARPLLAQATYTSHLDERKLHVVLDPSQREYVIAWVGKGKKANMLVVPLARFTAAGGKL
jgi:hypothetical protein